MGSFEASQGEIDALRNQLTEIENQTYYYEGQSQDVIQFIIDNSVVAMRFDSVYNLMKDTRMVETFIRYTDATDRYLANTPSAYAALTTSLNPLFVNVSGFNTSATNPWYFQFKSQFFVKGFTGTILNELKGKVVTIGLNNKFGLLNADGTLKANTGSFIIQVTRASSKDVTVIPKSQIVGGQIQFTVPADATGFYVCYAAQTAADMALIKPEYNYNDPNLIGMWIVS